MRIAILGSAGSLPKAPFKNSDLEKWAQGRASPPGVHHAQVDGDWDIWCCSPGAWSGSPRITRFFEVHRWEPGAPWFSPEYCQFLRDFKGPVYVGGAIPEIPNAVLYPIDKIEEMFSSYFLTSSLALMVALAIHEIEELRKQPGHDANEDVIGLWGVDMAACPSPETRVLTTDLRWVRADSLEIGDELIAFDEEAHPFVGGPFPKRKWRKATVQRNDRITKPCYRLTLEDGRELVCSDEHKWLTHAEHECRWRMAKEMVTPQHRADRPSRIVKLCDVWEEDKSWGAGYLAAAFDGEGHITQKLRDGDYGILRTGFSQRDNAMSRTVTSLMEEMGFDLGEDARNGTNGDCAKYTIRGGRAKTMEFLGRIRPRRLLEKFTAEHLGILQKEDTVAVVKAEFIGEQPVIGLTTSTGTFVAEGFASHNTEEYSYQRPGCQFFVLEALRRGIGVYLPPESDLMRPMPVYGISEWDHNYIKLTGRSRELNASLQEKAKVKMENELNCVAIQGELHALDYFVKTWVSPYGLPPGIVLKHEPGTGLGSGVTALDLRPLESKTPLSLVKTVNEPT